MLESYGQSVAPGTAANRLTQAKAYVRFSLIYHFDPLRPSGTNMCMYMQYLKNSFSAPTTVKNYLSGARTWVGQHGGELSAFTSPEYHQMSIGLNKRSQHVPSRAAPLDWDNIRIIIDFLDTTPGIPLGIKPCVLIGYHTFLRASNLLSPTMSAWGGPHTLSVKDLRLSDAGLEISVHSTKTKSDARPVKTLIPWGHDPIFCPTSAWLKYLHKIRPWCLGPAFLTDAGSPLTPRHVVGFMRLALRGSKELAPGTISLHSLRRGAVQSAAKSGVSHDAIKERGMWRSDSGVAPYFV